MDDRKVDNSKITVARLSVEDQCNAHLPKDLSKIVSSYISTISMMNAFGLVVDCNKGEYCVRRNCQFAHPINYLYAVRNARLRNISHRRETRLNRKKIENNTGK